MVFLLQERLLTVIVDVFPNIERAWVRRCAAGVEHARPWRARVLLLRLRVIHSVSWLLVMAAGNGSVLSRLATDSTWWNIGFFFAVLLFSWITGASGLLLVVRHFVNTLRQHELALSSVRLPPRTPVGAADAAAGGGSTSPLTKSASGRTLPEESGSGVRRVDAAVRSLLVLTVCVAVMTVVVVVFLVLAVVDVLRGSPRTATAERFQYELYIFFFLQVLYCCLRAAYAGRFVTLCARRRSWRCSWRCGTAGSPSCRARCWKIWRARSARSQAWARGQPTCLRWPRGLRAAPRRWRLLSRSHATSSELTISSRCE